MIVIAELQTEAFLILMFTFVALNMFTYTLTLSGSRSWLAFEVWETTSPCSLMYSVHQISKLYLSEKKKVTIISRN